MSGGLTPCRQLRPSSRREKVPGKRVWRGTKGVNFHCQRKKRSPPISADDSGQFTSVQASLDRLTGEWEPLTGETVVRTVLQELPAILVLHVIRFKRATLSKGQGFMYTKYDAPINIDRMINVQGSDATASYKFISVQCHVGLLHSGHYWTANFSRDAENSTTIVNDEKVQEATMSRIFEIHSLQVINILF